MKIYTKILLGMLAGALIGLFLGPKSANLEKDLYKVADGARVELRLDRSRSDSKLAIPARAPLRMLQLEPPITAALKDTTGATHTQPVWVKVRFELSKKIALLDASGALRKQLGQIVVGAQVEAWLKIDNQPIEGGGFQSLPVAISDLGDTVVQWLKPVGALFMRLIKMVIVPLVFASLLVGVASLGDLRKLGRLGGKTLLLYLCTTAIAVTIGLVCAHVINPGAFVEPSDRAALQATYDAAAGSKVEAAAEAPSAVDNILAIIPSNPVESLASGKMLQVIFFAVIFGIALTMLGPGEGLVVVTFFDKVQQAMIMIIHMVMIIAPYGVAALIAEVVGTSGFSILKALAVYAATVLIGLAIHAFFIYGGIVKVLVRMPLLDFLRAARPAQLIAFSTSSSSAALPVTMECAEQNLGISNPVSSFVIPLGSTVNMDGTALYQGVAAIFIAQVFQVDLSVGAQLGIVLTATMASIGAAGVPGAGIVTLAMVLTASGIPTVGVALILGMDRLLDMFRTAVNVTGDLAVTAVMAASEGETVRYLGDTADAADSERGFEGRLDHEPQAIDPETGESSEP